jgi:hypothetical protein
MKQQRYLIDWSHKGGYPILLCFLMGKTMTNRTSMSTAYTVYPTSKNQPTAKPQLTLKMASKTGWHLEASTHSVLGCVLSSNVFNPSQKWFGFLKNYGWNILEVYQFTTKKRWEIYLWPEPPRTSLECSHPCKTHRKSRAPKGPRQRETVLKGDEEGFLLQVAPLNSLDSPK